METTEFNHVLPEEGYLNDLDIERDYKLDLLLGKVDLLLEQQSHEVVVQESLGNATIVAAANLLNAPGGVAIARIPAGTRVRALRISGNWIQVGIISGPQQGRNGWVARSIVR